MTEPLTPPDCDLRGLLFMPLDVLRLRDSDLSLVASGDEFKAAVLLWCASWHQVPAAKGRFVHGDKGDLLTGTAVQAPAAPEPVIALREEGVLDLPAADQSKIEAAPAPVVDDLADARTTPGDSPEKLEAIEREVDEANADAKAKAKAKGATQKPKRSPEEEADRKAAIAILREKGVKFFAGATTEALVAQAAEA